MDLSCVYLYLISVDLFVDILSVPTEDSFRGESHCLAGRPLHHSLRWVLDEFVNVSNVFQAVRNFLGPGCIHL